MMGTTELQLEEAARIAADTAKYSTYLHGLQITDSTTSAKQADEIGDVSRKRARKEAESKAGLSPPKCVRSMRGGAAPMRRPAACPRGAGAGAAGGPASRLHAIDSGPSPHTFSGQVNR